LNRFAQNVLQAALDLLCLLTWSSSFQPVDQREHSDENLDFNVF
jgi:hypothetical protein